VEVPGAAEALAAIRALGRVPGIVINPGTPPENASPFLGMADFAIVMTVHPGFYGQKLIPECLDKVAVLKHNARALGRELVVSIDGGVSIENAFRIASAGADEVVAGAAVFKSADYRTAIRDLRQSGAQIGA
jgi:ribulose-phosphate 3-epimerase